MHRGKGTIVAACASVVALSLMGMPLQAFAQVAVQQPGEATTPEQPKATGQAEEPAAEPDEAQTEAPDEPASQGSDLTSFSLLLDARLVGADGNTSFVDGGLGKTRFDGDDDGDFRIRPLPIEAALIWQPRFTNNLAGNVSAAWQRDQDNDVDLLEAYLTWHPPRGARTGFSFKAGLYWPEISLEHATGGAWSTVNTITPSAINSWVGEEVKVIGAEATIMQTLGTHEVWGTVGAFGFNDTSGTLLSFRGWALHDIKATAFGYFELPPLNDFIVHLQESRTKSLIEIDDRVGFYGRLDWRPPWPFTINAFYYDNRGDPEEFTTAGQWGWRTRFLNVGLSADLGQHTRLLAQGIAGSTKMGFKTMGRIWVDTEFRSAFGMVTHEIGQATISGRIEFFKTEEKGSRMSPLESEDGWALTVAGRQALTDNITAFAEVLHVESERGVRVINLGIPAKENQTVVQLAMRLRL